MRLTKREFVIWLNEIGTPEGDKRENGGRVPGTSSYGQWLRYHDPIAFTIAYREWQENARHARERSA